MTTQQRCACGEFVKSGAKCPNPIHGTLTQHAIYMRKWRREHPASVNKTSRDYRSKNADRHYKKVVLGRDPQRVHAQRAVYRAVKSGKLVRAKNCESCGGSSGIQAHHPDYTKPLEVVWLCRPCHLSEHGKEARI